MLDLSFLRHSCLPLDAALPLPEVCACDLHRQVVPPERRHSVSRCRRALGKTNPACTTPAAAASFCQQATPSRTRRSRPANFARQILVVSQGPSYQLCANSLTEILRSSQRSLTCCLRTLQARDQV